MSDEDLIGYLFDLLDPAEHAAVACRIQADPEVSARLERLRAEVAPMLAGAEAEREDPPEPPPGLALRAISAAAKQLAEQEPSRPEPSAVAAFLREYSEPPTAELEFASGTRAKPPEGVTTPSEKTLTAPPTDGPEYRGGIRLRADVLVAACIAFVGLGLVLSGVAKARHNSRVAACQNSLRTLYTGLSGYADNDPQGRYLQVGTPEAPTADAFATSLTDLGYLPPNYKPGCPAGPDCPVYTYTLGFRGANNEVVGLRRPTNASDPADENDLMPLVADLPAAGAAPAGGPYSPHGATMEVLFAGGNVRSTRSPNIGPRGDHIYCNLFGNVAAGANRADAVLGGPGTRP